jgi:hypothetical protein
MSDEKKLEDLKLEDVRFGLMVIDPESLDENQEVEIVHFVGYWNQPSEVDADSLREELATDEEFGLTDIAHRLDILPAPQNVVEHFMSNIEE